MPQATGIHVDGNMDGKLNVVVKVADANVHATHTIDFPGLPILVGGMILAALIFRLPKRATQ